MQDLSQYRIVSPAVSAGNLYEAERKADGAAVWIKLLPDVLARDASLMQRLQERLAALPRHENVQQVFEVSSEGEITFCVLERLQGTTLKDRLAKGPYHASETDASFAELLSEQVPAADAAPALPGTPDIKAESAPEPAPIPSPNPTAPGVKPFDPNAGIIIPDEWKPVPTSNTRHLQLGDRFVELDMSPAFWEEREKPPKVEMTPAMLRLSTEWESERLFPSDDRRSTTIALLNELAVYKFAIQVLSALQAMHKAGIVCGALSPTNIFVCEKDTAKLINLEACLLRELSLPVGTDAPADQNNATEQSEAEIVAYQSPEQAVGRTIDGRSDLFSLGSILYEMATGSRAFTESTAEELRHAIARRENLMPQTLYPTNITRLNAVIVRALERDRGMRYKTAGDMLAAIEPLKTGVERQLQRIKDSANAAKESAKVVQSSGAAEAVAVAEPANAGVKFQATSVDDRILNLSPLDQHAPLSEQSDYSRSPHFDAEVDYSKMKYGWSKISHPRLVAAGLAVIGAAILVLLVLYFAVTWHPR